MGALACSWTSGVSLISGAQSEVTHVLFSLSSLLQVFTKYGKCYMFNSGEDGKPLLTTVKGGTGNGLEIMLDIQQDEYLPIWGETGELGTGTGAGGDGGGARTLKDVCLGWAVLAHPMTGHSPSRGW